MLTFLLSFNPENLQEEPGEYSLGGFASSFLHRGAGVSVSPSCFAKESGGRMSD